MNTSINDHNPYNSFNLKQDLCKNFTSKTLLTILHMTMFVGTSIVIKINTQVYESINLICKGLVTLVIISDLLLL